MNAIANNPHDLIDIVWQSAIEYVNAGGGSVTFLEFPDGGAAIRLFGVSIQSDELVAGDDIDAHLRILGQSLRLYQESGNNVEFAQLPDSLGIKFPGVIIDQGAPVWRNNGN